MSLIDSSANGATEVPGTSADATFVFLAGPIRHWWSDGVWDSVQHQVFTMFRDQVHDLLSADFLVYAPHRAWRGPWNEVAQRVNDAGVLACHALVELYVPGIVAEGTASEVALAKHTGIPVFRVAVGNQGGLDDTLKALHAIDTKRRRAHAVR